MPILFFKVYKPMKTSFSKTITKPDIPKVETMQFCTYAGAYFKTNILA